MSYLDFIPEHRKRNSQILTAIKKGETHTSIGKRFGLSKSRIGVILMKAKRLGLYRENTHEPS